MIVLTLCRRLGNASLACLTCSKCGRSGQYRKATLIQKYGRDIPLPDLLHQVGASCPKMDKLGNDPCGVCYEDIRRSIA